MKRKIEISIIYAYYNTPEEFTNSLKSIKQAIDSISYEVIVVDNNSTYSISNEISYNQKITIIRNKVNIGYGRAINQASRIAKGKYFLICNTDTVFFKNSIWKLLKKIKTNKSVGIIGPQMLNENKKVLPTISQNPTPLKSLFAYSFLNKLFPSNCYSKSFWLYGVNRKKDQYVDVISGACFLISKELFKDMGGFDERFFMYFEEADLCRKVSEKNKKILYYPRSKIIHSIGKSSNDNEWIESQYEKSRFMYLKKYYGFFPAFLTEVLLRISKINSILLIGILILSLFINLFHINTLLVFIGDMGRDYLAARDMILTGNIPLVGIRSSVIWLHQGPLSIYLIGLSLLVGKFDPVIPAILYGVLGSIATYVIYLMGKLMFNKKIGLLSALFFTTSPLFIINARMPYHTSPIPLFSTLFFLLLYKSADNKKLFSLACFIFGILLQLELSNIIIFPVVIIYTLFIRMSLKKKEILYGFLSFILGIIPFILYDITHNFAQTIGFPLWIANRFRIFLQGIFAIHLGREGYESALLRIYQQASSAIFPASKIVVFFVIVIVLIVIISQISRMINGKNNPLLLIVLWVSIPLIGFIIHSSPGPAYFPVLYPGFSVLVIYSVYCLWKKKILVMVIILCCIFNVIFVIKSQYFLITKQSFHSLPPLNYVLGTSIDLQRDVAQFIVRDANGQNINLKAGGFISSIPTSIDNFKYLVWYYGGSEKKKAVIHYIIYEDKNSIKKTEKVVFQNNYYLVVKK